MNTQKTLFSLLLFMLLGISTNCFSQTYKQEAEAVIQPLDKNILTTNILYDRVFPLAHLQDFTGQPGTDTTNTEHFHQAYYELYNSMTSTTGFITPEAFNNYLKSTYSGNNHTIGMMLFKYNYLDTNAIRNNLVYQQNGILYDTPNRTGSPYVEKTFFAATPLFPAEAEITQGEHTFSFDPSTVLSNTPFPIQSVSIDFDDGYGVQEIYNGSDQFRNSGKNQLRGGVQQRGLFSAIGRFFGKLSFIVRVVVVLTDGRTYESISRVAAKPAEEVVTAIENCNGGDQIPITGYPFNGAAFGRGTESATGRAYIFYSNANCASRTVTKPIIFLDGFDPTNDRDVQKIYDQYINTKVQVNGIDVRLGDKLRAAGYDIIVYNYEDGGDLLEKNSLAVVKLLEELYSRYGSTMQEDFVVIGPSMGALIAQYALAYAESHNIAHHTRLYISFDGPHQGANAPLGLQQTLDYLFQQGISSAVFKKMRDGLHRVPAAREMIVHHSDTGSETPQPDNFRNIFLANLNSINKYPTQLRKIAIVNGSNNLTPNQYIQPGGEMLYVQIKRGGLLGLISGKLGDRLRLNISAGANDSRVKSADIWLFSPLLNLFLWRGPQYTKYIQPAGNNYGYDASVGSYFGDPILPNSKTEAWIDLGQTLLYLIGGNKSTFRHNINPTFMPTTSSMDLQVPYFTLGYDFSNENIVCTGKTPFDRVYAPSNNQPHVQITGENAIWFENEIKGIQSPQPGGTGTFTGAIAGPSQMIKTETYSIANLPTGSTVAWSATPYNIASLTPSGNNVILNRTFFGKLTLQAIITTPCGAYPPITKEVEVIIGPTPIIGKNFVCQLTPETYYIQNLSPTASVSWSIPANAGGVLQLTQNSPSANQLSIKNQGWYSVQTMLTATVTDNGTTTLYELPVAAVNYAVGGNYVQDGGMVNNQALPPGSGYASSSTTTLVNPFNEVRVTLSLSQYEQINFVAGPTPRYWYYDSGKLVLSLPVYYYGAPSTWQVTKVGGSCPANLHFMANYIPSNAFSAAPNPASSSVTVSQNDIDKTDQQSAFAAKNTGQISIKKSYAVKFIDEKGKVVVESTSANGQDTQINTANLENGTYFLHIQQGKEVVKKQIIVRH